MKDYKSNKWERLSRSWESVQVTETVSDHGDSVGILPGTYFVWERKTLSCSSVQDRESVCRSISYSKCAHLIS